MRAATVSRRLGAVLVVASVVLVAACGSSGSDEPAAESSAPTSTTVVDEPTTTSTTAPIDPAKAEFIAEADAICQAGRDALEGKAPPVAVTDAMLTYIVDSYIPTARKQLTDIRALTIPPGDEAEVGAMLDATDAALDAVAADPAGTLESGVDPFAEVNAQLKAYGLQVCGTS